MRTLQEILRKDPEHFLKHPRFKMIDEMVIRINKDREGTRYKPLSKKVIGIKTSHLSIDDLGFLLKKMQQSHFPGKIFFGMLKIKK